MTSDPLPIDDSLSLDALRQVAVDGRNVTLTDAARRRICRASDTVDDWLDENRRIYGLTTGFGPLASHTIDPGDAAALQRGLVEHLSSGVGDPMSVDSTRAMMLARLTNLSRGHSAVRLPVADLLVAFLNHDITPVIPAIGTVGASGDLTPLAHMARTLMGHGEVWLDDGAMRCEASDAFERIEPSPLSVEGRDALALVNGTAAMTGIAALNGVDAIRATDTALRLGLLNAELFNGHREAWDPELGEIRPHPGQARIHEQLASLTSSSDRLTDPSSCASDSDELPQDRYSIRCLPQIFGAVLDEVHHHNRIARTELNSVTDNPVVDHDRDRAIHGGNFYGQHVAFGSDHLAAAMTKLAIHGERVVERICAPDKNRDFPPFLQPNDPGLQSGFMGAQVTATSLVAEMRTHGASAATQSIPTNADNQDVVPMGTTAARRAADHLDHLWHLLSIEALTLTQAFDLAGGFDDDHFCHASQQLAARVREVSPPLTDDRSLADDIDRVADALRDSPATLPAQAPSARTDDGTST